MALLRWMQTAAAASRALSFEAGAALLCYELYPLGMLGRPIPYLPLGRGGAGHRPPLLFIHGVLHNGSAFTWMKQRLALAGWNTFHEIKLATTRDTVPAMASRTADCIERLMARHRCSQVDVVAHSLGGLVARYYLQFLGGDGRVRNLITLGTPHRGTYWSRLSPWPHLKDLHPESPLMKRLNRLPVPHRTRIVAVSGARDVLM